MRVYNYIVLYRSAEKCACHVSVCEHDVRVCV